jgi:ElaB/YqjD/DUF883 family membrane-anchored ribosome-binding protein
MLDALKNIKKVNEPIMTPEEKAAVVNKAEIKGTGFNMEIVQSSNGKTMIEKQRDSRRQRHIRALKESTKFIDQFYDNFAERRDDIKNRADTFINNSDGQIGDIM